VKSPFATLAAGQAVAKPGNGMENTRWKECAARMKTAAEAAHNSSRQHKLEADNLRAHANRSQNKAAEATRRQEVRRENSTRMAARMMRDGAPDSSQTSATQSTATSVKEPDWARAFQAAGMLQKY